MGTGCQRNVYWLATNHLSSRGLVQPIKELSSAAGLCAGRCCALIRQLANKLVSVALKLLTTCGGSTRCGLGYALSTNDERISFRPLPIRMPVIKYITSIVVSDTVTMIYGHWYFLDELNK